MENFEEQMTMAEIRRIDLQALIEYKKHLIMFLKEHEPKIFIHEELRDCIAINANINFIQADYQNDEPFLDLMFDFMALQTEFEKIVFAKEEQFMCTFVSLLQSNVFYGQEFVDLLDWMNELSNRETKPNYLYKIIEKFQKVSL